MKNAAFALLLLGFASTAHADLASEVRATTGWLGYSVPVAGGRQIICSWDTLTIGDWDGNRPASALVVLLNVDRGKVEEVRVSSPECPVEKPVRKIAGISAQESLRFLNSLIENDSAIGKKAVTAVALHEGAEDTLMGLARSPRSNIRSHALFWLGQRAGEKAASIIKNAIDNDPEEGVRTKAVFALSQLPDDQSIPLLVELMQTHRSRSVRKKAAFWLGQKDDPRALAALESILAR